LWPAARVVVFYRFPDVGRAECMSAFGANKTHADAVVASACGPELTVNTASSAVAVGSAAIIPDSAESWMKG